MLTDAQDRYGPRDLTWTPVGVEFSADGPQLWFPGTGSRNIAVQLATNALGDNVLACYQLAHECVHLLAPDGRRGAPVLEEGLATVFSEHYVAAQFGRGELTRLPSYVDAAAQVRKLLTIRPTAIRELRAMEPCFKKMTVSTFEDAGLSNVPAALVSELLAPFRHE